MRIHFSLLFSLSFFVWSVLSASDLKINNVTLYQEGPELYALVDLAWDNAWRQERNHDAVWLFFKFLRPGGGYVHAALLADGHTATHQSDAGAAALEIAVPADRTGLFLFPSRTHRGRVQAVISVRIDRENLSQVNIYETAFRAYGLEMVYIPSGPFFLGDPDTTALRFGAFYRSGGNGAFGGTFRLEAEEQVIQVGPETGGLYYRSGEEGYEGDRQGPVPASFPKGVQGFYIMKYELTQGQYADFLNTLSAAQTQYRVIYGHREYYQHRGSLRQG